MWAEASARVENAPNSPPLEGVRRGLAREQRDEASLGKSPLLRARTNACRTYIALHIAFEGRVVTVLRITAEVGKRLLDPSSPGQVCFLFGKNETAKLHVRHARHARLARQSQLLLLPATFQAPLQVSGISFLQH